MEKANGMLSAEEDNLLLQYDCQSSPSAELVH